MFKISDTVINFIEKNHINQEKGIDTTREKLA